MSDLQKAPDFKDLFDRMSKMGQPEPPALPSAIPDFAAPPAQPAPKKQNVSPEIMAQVQSLVWGNGNPPPLKPPTKTTQQMGQTPALNQTEGWGRVSG